MGTKNGYKLAGVISTGRGPYASGWFSINEHEVCSAICRDATKLHRLSEEACNGHPAQGNPTHPATQVARWQAEWDARIERETAAAEERIRRRAKLLPYVESVDFQGDPRGAPVALVMTEEWIAAGGKRGDLAAWGNDRGVVVPYGRRA